jgi:lathosterol oxidase
VSACAKTLVPELRLCSAGTWDFLLYSSYSPVYTKMSQYKFNPVYPKAKQIAHDMFWVLVSTLISSVFEILLLHAYATGQLTYANPTVWWSDLATILWLLSMPYWRLAHFYIVHRTMHPWKTTSIPDVGRFLYHHVHSLHHRSKNPTAFSGTSMHPVESIIYYTASLIPVYFGAHPLIFLYTKFDLTLAALIGHDGFGFPGSGSQTHWLHHHLFECNYGEEKRIECVRPWGACTNT